MNNIFGLAFLALTGYLVYPYTLGNPVTVKNLVIAVVSCVFGLGALFVENKVRLMNLFSKIKLPSLPVKKASNKQKDRDALDHLLTRATEEKRDDLKLTLLDLFNEFTEIHNGVK